MSNPKDCLREEIAQQIKNKFPDAKERKKLKIKISGSKAELTKIVEEQKVPLLCVPKAMRPKRAKRTPANAIILYENDDKGDNKSVKFNKIKPEDFKPFDMETDCMIRGMKSLMIHQRQFSESFFNSNYRGALAIHGVGSGKTLSAVVISNCYLDLYPNKKVVFIAPSALLANFQKELYYFYSKSIFKADELPYNPLTDPRYSFFSYEKYTRSPVDCVDGLMIVDECHNLRSRMNVEETTMYDADGKEVKVMASKANIRGFKILQNCAKRADKVLLLTGTPLINTPSDIENMMAFIDGRDPDYSNLVYKNELLEVVVRQKEKKPDEKEEDKKKIVIKTVKKPGHQNILETDIFKKYSDYFGYKISFFIPSDQWKTDNFPRRIDNYVFFNLDDKQQKKYTNAKAALSKYFGYEKDDDEEEEKEGAGLSGGAGDKDPLESFYTGERRLANVMDMSLKIDWIVNLVRSSKTDKSLIYSNYLDTGAKAITDELKNKGFKEGKDYAFINSTISRSDRDKFQNAYNNDTIRVIFLSRAGAEGLSFLKTKNVIILEPNWNQSIVEQIVARGIRAGSHKMLDEKNRYVSVYYLNMGVEEASKIAIQEIIWGDLHNNSNFIFVKNSKMRTLTPIEIKKLITDNPAKIDASSPYSVNIVKKVVPVDLKILELSIYKQKQINSMMGLLYKVPKIEDFVNNDIEDLNTQIKAYEDKTKSAMPYKMKLELKRKIYEKMSKQQIKKVEDVIRKFWARISNEINKRKDITKKLQQLYNFIPTPVSVIDKMIQKSGILTNTGTLRVLEPTAGIGHIVAQLFDKSLDRESKNLNLFVDMCEFLPANRNSLISIFGDNPNMRLLEEPDFMQLDTSTVYDYIFMNPPFTIKQQDKTLYAVDFITKAYNNLKEGGKLVAILPPFDFKQNKPFSTFKEFIKDKIIYTEDLGDIFKNDKQGSLVYTTGIKTVLIILQKPVLSLFGNMEGSGVFDFISDGISDAYSYVKQKYEDVKADVADRGSAVLTRTNYVGPFNRLDDEYIRTHPPVDIIDEGAMKHDLEYSRIAKLRDDGKIGQTEADNLIRKSDIAFLDNIRDNWKVNPWASALGYAGIKNKNILEDYVGLDKNLFVGQGRKEAVNPDDVPLEYRNRMGVSPEEARRAKMTLDEKFADDMLDLSGKVKGMFGGGQNHSLNGLKLHAVIIKKPYDLEKAKQTAANIIKDKKKKFYRETDNSYRFRNIPKTKFVKKSFRTKKINDSISLIFGMFTE